MNDDTNINLKGLLDGKTVISDEKFAKLAEKAAKYEAVITVLEHITTIWSNGKAVPLDVIREIISKFGRED